MPKLKNILTLVAFFYAPQTNNNKITTKSGNEVQDRIFPKNFKFGTALSAVQTEGAWNVDGKGPSIWDEDEKKYPFLNYRINITKAANFYEKYKEDVQLLKNMAVETFRFSISWSRIMADGTLATKNEKGLQFYDNLIDELIVNDIEPMVTMHHFDVPQFLQDLGGWANPMIIDHFVEYAEILFERYGNKVKYWMTINEPAIYCIFGYETEGQIIPPFVLSPGIGCYICVHNMLLAHAKVYHLYKKKYSGQIGIVMDSEYSIPKDSSNIQDIEAQNRELQFRVGWVAHPIFSDEGDYPPLMRKIIDENSRRENLKRSRLPKFSPEEVELLKGSADFIGLNYYTSHLVELNTDVSIINQTHSRSNDLNTIRSSDPNWASSESFWLFSVPEGFRNILRWIKNEYNNPRIFITENGWSDDDRLNDQRRINYVRDHLNVLLDAILIDGCNVERYLHWSFLDSFEFSMGYRPKFGLIRVNYDSDQLERTPKQSSLYYREVIRTKRVPDSYEALSDIGNESS